MQCLTSPSLGKLLSKTNGSNELLAQSVGELKKKGLYEFHYRHLGSFAYVGDNKAVLEVPVFGKTSSVLCVVKFILKT